MSIFIDIINSIVEMFIVLFFFDRMLERKQNNKVLLMLICLLIVAFHVFRSCVNFPWMNVYLNLAISAIICFALAMLLFDADIRKKVFVVCIYMVSLYMSDILTRIIISQIFRSGYNAEIFHDSMRYSAMLISNFLNIIILMYFSFAARRRKIDKEAVLSKKYWIIAVLYPLFSIFLIVSLDMIIVKNNTSLNDYITLVIAAVGLVFFNVIVFDLIESYSDKIHMAVMEEIIEKNEENYKLLEKNEDKLRQLNHDINKHVLVAKELISDKDKSAEFVDALEKTAKATSAIVYTGDAVLDSIFNIESKKAEIYDIKYIIKTFYMEEPMNISPVDKSSLFCNLLNNAIEACGKLGPQDEKFIIVDIRTTKNEIKITIKNSSVKTNIRNNGVKTTKSDKDNHGIGISSVKSLLKKYGGLFEIKYANGIFETNIFMKNGEKK